MADELPAEHRLVATAPTLARIRKLQNNRIYRDQNRLFFVEGVRNFVAAVDHQFAIDTLVYSEKLLTAPLARKLVRQLKRAGVPFARLSPEEFRSISKTEQASGVGAILKQRLVSLAHFQPQQHLCWTVLSEVRSPGNFGTLLRTSAATGASGFILLGDSIDPYDPLVVRATMGALFSQTLIRASLDEFQQWIQDHNLHVVGASPDGSVAYNQLQYPRPTVLLLGAERSGLTAEQRALCHQLVRIPMASGVDSLNLGVAGGLLLYEIMRSVGR